MSKNTAEASSIADDITEDHDRISSLPDDILHEILVCLRSHKQAVKVASLSRRWNHLWLSYPVLEFNHNDYTDSSPSRSTMNSFIAAARRKLSSSSGLNYIKSFRIVARDLDFYGAIFDLIQDNEPEHIDMSISIGVFISSQYVIPTLLLNSSRLRTLKLFGFKLLEDQCKKMINLRVLHLCCVNIDNRVLNIIIAAAPLLEKLTLQHFFCSIKKVEVCNHANLKHIQMTHMSGLSEIVVGALHSLESLSLTALHCHDLEIICSSELPSLKSLEIAHCPELTDHVVNKLISISPSLLSLRLGHMNTVNELEIESPTLEKLELDWYNWHPKRVLQIDAPSSAGVLFSGQVKCSRAEKCRFELSLYRGYLENDYLKELKELLRKLTRQFQLNDIN